MRPPNLRAWLVVAMVVSPMLINFGDKAVLGLAAGPSMRELGLSAAEYVFSSNPNLSRRCGPEFEGTEHVA